MKDEAGFTLVELLAALVAGGLLLALLGALTGGFGQELRRSVRGDRFDRIAAASALLDRMLAGVEPGPGANRPVEADPEHLTAFVDPPLARRGAGPMRLELTVIRQPSGAALELTLQSAGGGFAEHRTLVDGMRAIAIRTERDDGIPPNRPPRLITIAFTTLSDEQWELAVEPRLTGVGGCRFDPIALACRS